MKDEDANMTIQQTSHEITLTIQTKLAPTMRKYHKQIARESIIITSDTIVNVPHSPAISTLC